MRLSGSEYEQLGQELIARILLNPPMSQYEASSGSLNVVKGASGYQHQIDITLESGSRLFLLELKHYQRRVGVEEVLVLASRLRDIAEANPSKEVTAMLVSKREPTAGALVLAKHFNVKLEVIESLQSFGLGFAEQQFVGLHEQANAQDEVDATVTRGPSPA